MSPYRYLLHLKGHTVSHSRMRMSQTKSIHGPFGCSLIFVCHYLFDVCLPELTVDFVGVEKFLCVLSISVSSENSMGSLKHRRVSINSP